MVSSQRFDENIYISHTDSSKGKLGLLTLEREVEPMTIKIFDMIINFKHEFSKVDENNKDEEQ